MGSIGIVIPIGERKTKVLAGKSFSVHLVYQKSLIYYSEHNYILKF